MLNVSVDPLFEETNRRAPARFKSTKVRKRRDLAQDRSSSGEPKEQWSDHILRIKKSQDKEAFALLFGHFAPRIKSFLMKAGADDVLAEDCAQEAMITVWNKAHLFDPTRASAATWIFTIARNKRIDVLRRQNRPEPEEVLWGPTEEPDAEDVLAMEQENERLAEAVKELPENQRLMVTQAFYGELSHQEIADRTGLPLGTIKSRIRLALEKLRHTMK